MTIGRRSYIYEDEISIEKTSKYVLNGFNVILKDFYEPNFDFDTIISVGRITIDTVSYGAIISFDSSHAPVYAYKLVGDKNILLSGITYSGYMDKFFAAGNYGGDFILIKFNKSGSIEWAYSYGGLLGDSLDFIFINYAVNRRVVMIGHTKSFGCDPYWCLLLVEVDTLGNVIRSKIIKRVFLHGNANIYPRDFVYLFSGFVIFGYIEDSFTNYSFSIHIDTSYNLLHFVEYTANLNNKTYGASKFGSIPPYRYLTFGERDSFGLNIIIDGYFRNVCGDRYAYFSETIPNIIVDTPSILSEKVTLSVTPVYYAINIVGKEDTCGYTCNIPFDSLAIYERPTIAYKPQNYKIYSVDGRLVDKISREGVYFIISDKKIRKIIKRR